MNTLYIGKNTKAKYRSSQVRTFVFRVGIKGWDKKRLRFEIAASTAFQSLKVLDNSLYRLAIE
jgi:hypothetical protein